MKRLFPAIAAMAVFATTAHAWAAGHSPTILVNFAGINTITEPSGDTIPLFSCYQGGKIYVDQIAGTIQPPPTTQNQGCLTIGGP